MKAPPRKLVGAPRVPHGTSGAESTQDTFLEASGALTDWTPRAGAGCPSITRAPCRKVMGVPGSSRPCLKEKPRLGGGA